MPKIIQVLVVGAENDIFTELNEAWALNGGECHSVADISGCLQSIVENKYHIISMYIPTGEEQRVIQDIAKIRSMTTVPIVTAAPAPFSSELRVAVFDAGADQFVSFPMPSHERVAIARAVIRRTMELDKMHPAHLTILIRRQLTICVEQRMAYVRDQEIKLLPKEFDILCLLAVHPGYWHSPAKIYETVWGDRSDENAPDALWSPISRLREKLKAAPDVPEFIESQRGVGYRFIPDFDTV
ncbi:MAG: response regulator transcription factor [Oscillospiraceae bacterium]|nr:response regulator transcription factor [Oscillospiraceae bacterium]